MRKCGEGVRKCIGRSEKFVGEWGDDVGDLRKVWGVGKSMGRGERNVRKYGEVLEKVEKVWVVWGSMGRCVWGEVCGVC